MRFVLATDGSDFEAEDLGTGEIVACAFADFPDHFGVFLPLAGISTVWQIRESAFDIRATRRLNKLIRRRCVPADRDTLRVMLDAEAAEEGSPFRARNHACEGRSPRFCLEANSSVLLRMASEPTTRRQSS